eukprot:TRINITY_DN1147_c1_g1_i1.p1 TRINITY_DN1147_c1_g1~~TRINITY_DN1147_c1_g1_i1.p1  ORF type:complete len:596 (-),score=154.24 TRINITY_DN1147_c1_g1_i1:61-1812(-)
MAEVEEEEEEVYKHDKVVLLNRERQLLAARLAHVEKQLAALEDRGKSVASVLGATKRADHDEYATNWVEDNSAPCCYGCGVAFSFLLWRHHCRSCGNVFCDTCSSKTFDIESAPQRVCNSCYTKLSFAQTPQKRAMATIPDLIGETPEEISGLRLYPHCVEGMEVEQFWGTKPGILEMETAGLTLDMDRLFTAASRLRGTVTWEETAAARLQNLYVTLCAAVLVRSDRQQGAYYVARPLNGRFLDDYAVAPQEQLFPPRSVNTSPDFKAEATPPSNGNTGAPAVTVDLGRHEFRFVLRVPQAAVPTLPSCLSAGAVRLIYWVAVTGEKRCTPARFTVTARVNKIMTVNVWNPFGASFLPTRLFHALPPRLELSWPTQKKRPHTEQVATPAGQPPPSPMRAASTPIHPQHVQDRAITLCAQLPTAVFEFGQSLQVSLRVCNNSATANISCVTLHLVCSVRGYSPQSEQCYSYYVASERIPNSQVAPAGAVFDVVYMWPMPQNVIPTVHTPQVKLHYSLQVQVHFSTPSAPSKLAEAATATAHTPPPAPSPVPAASALQSLQHHTLTGSLKMVLIPPRTGIGGGR